MTGKLLTRNVVFQVKVTLAGSEPPIWRRVQTKDCSLAQLHGLIQHVMGWENEHLYQFEVGEDCYTDLNMAPGFDERDAGETKLRHLVENGHTRMVYLYDFGDHWEHLVEVEETLPPVPGTRYPCCFDGERSCPPEDCGGIWGYADMLDTLADPDHPEREETLEWVGKKFNPEAFDPAGVNRRLRRAR